MFNSKRLKKLREDLGLSQIQMSEKLQIGQSSYSKYETNKADLNLNLLQKLQDEFNIDPREFINTTSNNTYFENGSIVHGNGVVNSENYYSIPKESINELHTDIQKIVLKLNELIKNKT